MAILLLVDLLAGVAAVTAASCVEWVGAPPSVKIAYLAASVLLPPGWLLALSLNRSYDVRQLFAGGAEYERVLRSGLLFGAAVALGAYLGRLDPLRGYVTVALSVIVATTAALRWSARRVLHQGRRRGRWMRRVVVVGHVGALTHLCGHLRRKPFHGLAVVGACVPMPDLGRRGGLRLDAGRLVVPEVSVPVYGSFDDAALAVEATGADTLVVLPCPELDGAALRRLAWQVEDDGVEVMLTTSLADVSSGRVRMDWIDGLPVLRVGHTRLRGTRLLAKAALDRCLGALLLLSFLPLIAALAVWIRLDSTGPALFRQRRVGRDGRTFRIYKLRTMYTDAERRLADLRERGLRDGVLFKLPDDPRITTAGRVIRRLSLDELPQLLNVLAGHMSLVGPRPPLASEVAAYPADMRRRLVVRPGMTGLWQVSGRSDLSWEETMRLDLRYVENWSLWLDMLILLRTITAVLRSAGAY